MRHQGTRPTPLPPPHPPLAPPAPAGLVCSRLAQPLPKCSRPPWTASASWLLRGSFDGFGLVVAAIEPALEWSLLELGPTPLAIPCLAYLWRVEQPARLSLPRLPA